MCHESHLKEARIVLPMAGIAMTYRKKGDKNWM
jgi:hypothetical protein